MMRFVDVEVSLMVVGEAVGLNDRSGRASVRNDWEHADVEALYSLPFADLVF